MNKTSKNDKSRVYFLSPAFIKAAEIRQSKSDYGDIFSYFPFGPQSFCHELHKKTKRLVNLAKTNEEPNWESIEDNLIDLINYASYYWEFLKGGN